MSIGDKIFVADKRTLDLVKNKVDNIYAIVPTNVAVPEPNLLNKNYIADKDTLDELKKKLDNLPELNLNGTAIEEKVLAGSTFYNTSTIKKTGSMTNNNAVSQILTTTEESYTIPKGYHDGNGKVRTNITNLMASNIKSGVNVGGVVGTCMGEYGEKATFVLTLFSTSDYGYGIGWTDAVRNITVTEIDGTKQIIVGNTSETLPNDFQREVTIKGIGCIIEAEVYQLARNQRPLIHTLGSIRILKEIISDGYSSQKVTLVCSNIKDDSVVKFGTRTVDD